MTHASAPGKVILFGEHAVVYGRPALAVPVTEVKTDVAVVDSSRSGIWIHAPQVDLQAEYSTLAGDHPIAAVIRRVFAAAPGSEPSSRPGQGLEINITSTIPIASGLGSGAAVSVALARALSGHLKHPMHDEEINAIAYEIEKIHHGTPSGIDNSVITHAMPVYFIKGRPVEMFKAGSPFTILIGDTGLAAPTRESVGAVRKLWEADQSKWETVFDEIGEIAQTARQAIETGRWQTLGGLMDKNHSLLQKLTVSSPELDELIRSARAAGALGAKLSGGGRGGNMIALVVPDQAASIQKALEKAGAKSVIITQLG